LDERIIKFAFGFLLEDNSYKIMEELPLNEIEAIVTSDTLVAEGALHYLKDQNYQIPIITFDSIKPRIDVDAYIDINALELGKESFRTLFQIIKDNKEDKQICYRQLIPHSISTR
jgi:HTH-type transcriptional regulator malR